MDVSQEHKRLYHYTTMNGLFGIIKSNSLWATHHKYLNDSSETLLFREKLHPLVHPIVLEEYTKYVEKNECPEINLDEIEQIFVSSLYDAFLDGFYITSFCGEVTKDNFVKSDGLLSQWRGYGQDGGVAIVFDTKKIEELLILEKNNFDYAYWALADVIYSDQTEKFEAELSPLFKKLRPYFASLIKSVLSKKPPDNGPNDNDAYAALISCINRYKHRGFKEENEVRIIMHPVVQNKALLAISKKENIQRKQNKLRLFREKNGDAVPYIELFSSLNVKLPIEKIIIGPHKNKEDRAAALKIMLRDTNIEVATSDIPYVGS